MDAPNDQSNFLREQSCIDAASSSERKVSRKKYHRHTPSKIQELENFFKEYPHPDKNQRVELSRRLGLQIKQVKFWFQNKRTQLKSQSERRENELLKKQYEKLQAENELLQQAYANPLCHCCGGTTLHPFVSFEHEKLKIENEQLKSELRVLCSSSKNLLNDSVTSSSASHLSPFSIPKPNIAMDGNDIP